MKISLIQIFYGVITSQECGKIVRKEQSIPKMNVLGTSKMRLELECFCLVFNKHTPAKIPYNKVRMNSLLELSRSDLAFGTAQFA